MYVGKKQRIATNLTIATSLTELGFVSGCAGAIAFLVKVWNGSNGNALTIMAGAPAWAAAAANVVAGWPPSTNLGTLGATNKTEITATGTLVHLDAALGYPVPCPAPFFRLSAQIATAQATGCNVDVWPIFATEPKHLTTAMPD